MSNYKKGRRREYELLDLFKEHGYVGMRSPSSGSTTDDERPDILVGNGDKIIGIELKSSSDDVIYIEGSYDGGKDEVKELYKFGRDFGCDKVRVASRFDYDEFWFYEDEDLYRTDSGNYRIKKGINEQAETISELVC